MNKSLLIKGVILVVALQVIVLITEYVNSVYPLWFGKEIKLNTVPVDPRSLFRGNYARLNYDISRLPTPVDTDQRLRRNTIVYVSLKKNKDGIHEFKGITVDKPDDGIFIRGRWASGRVRYGIEAFFAPKAKALKLERELPKGGVAVVMVASNGKASLQEVIPNEVRK